MHQDIKIVSIEDIAKALDDEVSQLLIAAQNKSTLLTSPLTQMLVLFVLLHTAELVLYLYKKQKER